MTTEIAGRSKLGIQNYGQSRFSAFGSAFVAHGFTMYPILLLLVVVGAIVAPRFLTASISSIFSIRSASLD